MKIINKNILIAVILIIYTAFLINNSNNIPIYNEENLIEQEEKYSYVESDMAAGFTHYWNGSMIIYTFDEVKE